MSARMTKGWRATVATERTTNRRVVGERIAVWSMFTSQFGSSALGFFVRQDLRSAMSIAVVLQLI